MDSMNRKMAKAENPVKESLENILDVSNEEGHQMTRFDFGRTRGYVWRPKRMEGKEFHYQCNQGSMV